MKKMIKRLFLFILTAAIIAGFTFSGLKIYDIWQDKNSSSKSQDREDRLEDLFDEDNSNEDLADNGVSDNNSGGDTPGNNTPGNNSQGNNSNYNNNGVGQSTGFTQSEASYSEVDASLVVENSDYGVIAINQYMIMLSPDYDASHAETIAQELGGNVVGSVEMIQLYQLELPITDEAMIPSTIQSLLAMDGVEDATVMPLISTNDVVGTPCTPYNDEVYEKGDNSAHYDMINMSGAWKIIKASGIEPSFVDVGVLDSAVYTGSKEINGDTFVLGDTTDNPSTYDNGAIRNNGMTHGTLVTHVIGADPSNKGVTGIASIIDFEMDITVNNLFDGEESFPAITPTADPDTTFTNNQYSAVIKSFVKLKQLIDGGATVINCSFGQKDSSKNYPFMEGAYQKFMAIIERNYPKVVIVGSAGNDGRNYGKLNGKNHFPGGFPHDNIVTVGAVNLDGTRADFSNYQDAGGEVTLSAPGVNIMMDVDANGNPVKASGTSFSAPQVTATIALMQSMNPDLTAKEIKEILKSTAQKTITRNDNTVTVSETMGAGVLDVEQAVLKAINKRLEKEGKTPLTLEQCLQWILVDLDASGTKEDTFIYASVPASKEGPVTLALSVEGSYQLLEGELSQVVEPGQLATWTIKIVDDQVKVKVTRLDTEGCSTLKLPQGDFEGTWDTTMNIISDTLTPLLVELIGEAFAESMTEMGCDVNDAGELETGSESSQMTIVISKILASDNLYQIEFISPSDTEGVEDVISDTDIINGSIDENGDLIAEYESYQEGLTIKMSMWFSILSENEIFGEVKLWIEGDFGTIRFTENQNIIVEYYGTRVDTGNTE